MSLMLVLRDDTAMGRCMSRPLKKNKGKLYQLSPLHEAAFEGDSAVIQRLIEHGVTLNVPDERQWTPLHWAAFKGHSEVIDLMLSHGADPFASNTDGKMPLHVARGYAIPALMEHVCGLCPCRKLHLVDPSKINAADAFGKTPLECSEVIEPFIWFYEDHPEAPMVHINVIDFQGTFDLRCAFGYPLRPLMHISWDSSAHGLLDAGKGHKMNRMQTHMLHHLLNRLLHYGFSDDNAVPFYLEKCLDFVFGSVLQGDGPNHGVCSWPCNHAHDHNEMEDILRMEGDVEALCDCLLASSIGKCDMSSTESLSVMGDVQLFLNDLSEFFKQYGPLLQFEWKKIGSSAEGTKTGQLDEFDVLMEFTELSQYMTVQSDCIKWVEMEQTVRQQLALYFPQTNCTHGVKARVFHMINYFISEKLTWGRLSFVSLRCFRCGYSAFFRRDYLIIKLDLVPVFKKVQGWYVFRGDSYVQTSNALRELEHLRSLPPSAQEGYIIAKSLRDVHLLGRMISGPIISDLVDRAISSHQLKHSLFHAVAHEKSPKEALKPYQWAQRIYMVMRDTWLRNFFSEEDLFKNNGPYPKQMYLNLFIQMRYGRDPFPKDMDERAYRRLFVNEICRILKC